MTNFDILILMFYEVFACLHLANANFRQYQILKYFLYLYEHQMKVISVSNTCVDGFQASTPIDRTTCQMRDSCFEPD